MNHLPHRQRRRGFTLVEILIALLAGMVVIAGVFVAATANSQVFFLQNQVAELQLSARFAMERIKADLRRGAFLGTANSDGDPLICPKPATNIEGIDILDGAASSSDVHLPAVNTNVEPDEFTVFGNMVNSDYFLIRSLAGSVVNLQALNLPSNSASYDAIFNTRSVIKLTNRETGSAELVGLTAADFASSSITLNAAPLMVTTGQLCGLTGITGEGHELSVLNFVRYALRADGTEVGKIDLVREDLESDGTTFLGTPTTIADYIVDFQMDYETVDTSGGVGEATMGAPSGGSDPDANPEIARSVVVTLTARTPREDPEWVHRPRAAVTDPLRSYDVDNLATGSARVRTVRMEVELPNFALLRR